MSGTYSDLEVWQAAMDLAEAVYRSTKTFPKEELYTLTSQLRRAAVSVPSNIAEGKGRSSERELIQFLHYSRASLFDWKLRSQLRGAWVTSMLRKRRRCSTKRSESVSF